MGRRQDSSEPRSPNACADSEQGILIVIVHLRLPYRHTQIGWVTLVSTLLPLLPLPLLLHVTHEVGTRFGLLLTIAALFVFAALFATLSVRVDSTEVRLWFGIGLIQRRFAVVDIVTFQEVTNPWSYGWGIRWYPGGTLYNVSGLSAVELGLANGRRVRIGTDDPSTLFLALESLLGAPRPLPEPTQQYVDNRRKRLGFVTLGLVGLFASTLPALMHVQAKPPVVTVTTDSIVVDNLFYGQRYAWTEVQDITLLHALPCILARTNGYAANGTLRGWFSVTGLGRGKLFVEDSHPPYIAIRLREGFVILNFANEQATGQLYQLLQEQMRLATPTLPTTGNRY